MTNTNQLTRIDPNNFTHSNVAALVLAKGDAPAFHARFVRELNEYQITPKLGATERADYTSDSTVFVAGGFDFASNTAARLELIHTARRLQGAYENEVMDGESRQPAPAAPASDHAAELATWESEVHAREIKACQLGTLDYAGYALCVVIGLVFGLLIASLTVSAVLSNLPQ